MKVLLIVGGVLFLLLAFVLFIAAAVMYFLGRRRAAAVPADFPQPATQPVPPPPPRPAPAPPAPPPARQKVYPTPPPPPPMPSLAPEVESTVMIDSRREQIWGALHATGGALSGRVFPIEPNGFYIGRDATQSQVVIDTPSISKRHVWVGVKDGAVVAVDQKSTNGTYLNTVDRAIGEVQLRSGDTLILSDDVARFTYRT